MDSKQREKNKIFLEGFDALVFALLAFLLLFTFIARTARVDGTSMLNTLQDGDQVLVYSLFYAPKQGDVVLIDSYTSYGKPLVKRVVAVAGDTVEIDPLSGEVYINGKALEESYVSSPTILMDVQYPAIVPEGKVFVMGDNRSDSKDSRDSEIGFIDQKEILGRVIYRVFPVGEFGKIE